MDLTCERLTTDATTIYKTTQVWAYLAQAFADWACRQEISRLGLADIVSRSPDSPRWKGIDPVEIAERIDAAVATRPDCDGCPRFTR